MTNKEPVVLETVSEEMGSDLELNEIRAMLLDGQGDDDGARILPEFKEDMTVLAMVEACVHLLERRRDALSNDAVIEAALNLLASRSSTFKARNGRDVGIEDDSGEKMWIVPFDEMLALESSLTSAPHKGADE